MLIYFHFFQNGSDYVFIYNFYNLIVYPIIYLPAIQPLTANAPIRLLEGKIE